MKLWESALQVAKNNLQEENNEFEDARDEAEAIRKMWDKEQIVKKKLNENLETLREKEAELNAQLKSQIDASKKVEAKLEKELSNVEKMESANTFQFKKTQSELEGEITKL